MRRIAAGVIVVALLAPVAPGGAVAQTAPESGQAETPEENLRQRVLEQSRDNLLCMWRIADAIARGDRARHTAILRTGLKLLKPDFSRVVQPVVYEWDRAPWSTVAVTPLDAEPESRRRIEELYARAGAPRARAACPKPRPAATPPADPETGVPEVVPGVPRPGAPRRDADTDDRRRIVVPGGTESSPIMGAVGLVRGRGEAFCSGVLVSKDNGGAILTAAHCVCHSEIPLIRAHQKSNLDAAQKVVVDRAAANAACRSAPCVVIGNDIDVAFRERGTDNTGPPALLFPIIGAVPLYRGSCSQFRGGVQRGKDVALVFLKPVRDASTSGLANITKIDPIIETAVYSVEAAKPDSTLHVVGFGRTGSCPGQPSVNLKKLSADIDIATVRCRTASFGQRYGCIAEYEMMLIRRSQYNFLDGCVPDTCNGDSGGPAYLHLPASVPGPEEGTTVELTQRYLAAITSRGLPGGRGGCGPGGIYTLVTPTIVYWMERWGINVVR